MRITSKNLDETIQLNRQIQSEINMHIKYFYIHFEKYDIYSPEKKALNILKDNYLIQVPIPDSDWGGAIRELPNGIKVPVINTAQPRLYQYFIYWHEIFHLTEKQLPLVSHEISTELDLTERKADYFASQMLLGKDLYSFFSSLKQKEFIERIAICMDTYKAPYKAILIELYESSIKVHDETLQEDIIANFDASLSESEWIALFKSLSLEDTLVRPSYTVDFGKLKSLVEENKNPDDRVYEETRNYILELETKYLEVKGKFESGAL